MDNDEVSNAINEPVDMGVSVKENDNMSYGDVDNL